MTIELPTILMSWNSADASARICASVRFAVTPAAGRLIVTAAAGSFVPTPTPVITVTFWPLMFGSSMRVSVLAVGLSAPALTA
jgi:hypothetical protein